MKKVQPWIALIGATFLLASSAQAAHHDRGGRYEHHQRFSNHHDVNWVVPLVIGGVLGYALSEPREETLTYVERSPVVYAPQPLYREQWVYFSDCDCQRRVWVKVR